MGQKLNTNSSSLYSKINLEEYNLKCKNLSNWRTCELIAIRCGRRSLQKLLRMSWITLVLFYYNALWKMSSLSCLCKLRTRGETEVHWLPLSSILTEIKTWDPGLIKTLGKETLGKFIRVPGNTVGIPPVRIVWPSLQRSVLHTLEAVKMHAERELLKQTMLCPTNWPVLSPTQQWGTMSGRSWKASSSLQT